MLHNRIHDAWAARNPEAQYAPTIEQDIFDDSSVVLATALLEVVGEQTTEHFSLLEEHRAGQEEWTPVAFGGTRRTSQPILLGALKEHNGVPGWSAVAFIEIETPYSGSFHKVIVRTHAQKGVATVPLTTTSNFDNKGQPITDGLLEQDLAGIAETVGYLDGIQSVADQTIENWPPAYWAVLVDGNGMPNYYRPIEPGESTEAFIERIGRLVAVHIEYEGTCLVDVVRGEDGKSDAAMDALVVDAMRRHKEVRRQARGRLAGGGNS